jgi:hypothetical protein
LLFSHVISYSASLIIGIDIGTMGSVELGTISVLLPNSVDCQYYLLAIKLAVSVFAIQFRPRWSTCGMPCKTRYQTTESIHNHILYSIPSTLRASCFPLSISFTIVLEVKSAILP